MRLRRKDDQTKEEISVPDIAMCMGGKCPIKKDCYRYRAIPNLRQNYFTIPPIEKECHYFWQLEKGHKIRLMEEIKETLVE